MGPKGLNYSSTLSFVMDTWQLAMMCSMIAMMRRRLVCSSLLSKRMISYRWGSGRSNEKLTFFVVHKLIEYADGINTAHNLKNTNSN